ncbi:leucine zipper transcription factor-like protein 1 [Schistocerca serialis cubense]|uniref:leucine zipper transcription factor-like protein 1 n=1 Tax=Schistocerca serialis cubense TaxID=2023355 RepID=UPI00214E38BD|nr:leucine zipper transcription factor-like protein 1 [Schistocerca serialis cubense]
MAELGLNEQHQSLIMTYIRFAKHQRAQNLKAVYCAFQDVIESRLSEETYTAEEVRELLCGLREAVRADVEAELMSHGRATALLLRQLLAQAERWHLRLSADMSQLQDREQLEQVAALEETGVAPERPLPAGGRLAPLGTDGGRDAGGASALLTAEVRRLEAHCGSLQEQLEEARLLAQVRQQQIIRLNDELDSAREKLAVAAASSQLAKERQEATVPSDRIPELEEQISQLSLSLSDSETVRTDVEHQLADTREELEAMKSRLTLAEKELESKFSETTAYTNMKRMLASKNEQLRELRLRLRALGEGGGKSSVADGDADADAEGEMSEDEN